MKLTTTPSIRIAAAALVVSNLVAVTSPAFAQPAQGPTTAGVGQPITPNNPAVSNTGQTQAAKAPTAIGALSPGTAYGGAGTTSGQPVHLSEADWNRGGPGTIAYERSHGSIPVAENAPAQGNQPSLAEGEMLNYRLGPLICIICPPSHRGAW